MAFLASFTAALPLAGPMSDLGDAVTKRAPQITYKDPNEPSTDDDIYSKRAPQITYKDPNEPSTDDDIYSKKRCTGCVYKDVSEPTSDGGPGDDLYSKIKRWAIYKDATEATSEGGPGDDLYSK